MDGRSDTGTVPRILDCEDVICWERDEIQILVGIYVNHPDGKRGYFLYHDEESDTYRRAAIPPSILFASLTLWNLIELEMTTRGVTLNPRAPANCIGPPDIAHL